MVALDDLDNGKSRPVWGKREVGVIHRLSSDCQRDQTPFLNSAVSAHPEHPAELECGANRYSAAAGNLKLLKHRCNVRRVGRSFEG